MYLLDADVFITAANSYYAFDLVPSFWSWLDQPQLHASVSSVVAVRDEVMAGQGDLTTWAHQLSGNFWLADDDSSLAMVGQLAAWATGGSQYRQKAVNEFMGSGDIRLIATAAAHGHTVVTNETPAPESRKRIKIPDVCAAFDVPCRNAFSAYRELGLQV